MKILLLTSKSCYPCERTLRELKKMPHLDIEMCERPNPAFEKYNVISTPTLIFDTGEQVHKLSGAHMIKKMEVEGLISDILDSQNDENDV